MMQAGVCLRQDTETTLPELTEQHRIRQKEEELSGLESVHMGEMVCAAPELNTLDPVCVTAHSGVKERISACLADISMWMATHHLKLNLHNTELRFIPHRTSPLQALSITVDGTMVAASRSARNLGMVLDDQLDIMEHIRATARSCRFVLYNIRRIRPYLTTYSIQLLVQTLVISRLDYSSQSFHTSPPC
ncbi:hypothetical protein SKAU_G00244080 [Synaphobranchus kaupii]|uniref:Uncharacterized protein n=1 Tax=Synaphobranchus kaupii TaxID=118154 RepID=A0A9Q1F1J7_SYNKA|nr:hypothetical protein SKAU_G00244080 [Synaphobranchus kaupii]